MRRRLAGASTALGELLAVLAAGFVGQRLRSNWDEVEDAFADARPGWTAAALLAVAGMTSSALPWRRALQLLGDDLDDPGTIARCDLGVLWATEIAGCDLGPPR